MALQPIQSVFKVTRDGAQKLAATDVTADVVGEKAYGLACLPQQWTLPFVVVCSSLLDDYRNVTEDQQKESLIASWLPRIRQAADEAGLPTIGPVLIRSSALTESLDERGRYHSKSGTFESLGSTLNGCLLALTEDPDIAAERVNLVIQREITPVSGKGHLSNERHCYEEARDWFGEFEPGEHRSAKAFSVNLRKWREEYRPSILQPLACNLEPVVSKVLNIPAWWAYRSNVRVHFEWVWDGRRIFIVQADIARPVLGVNPTKVLAQYSKSIADYTPKCLMPIREDHASSYHKIRNVYTYLSLKLPITNLYVLDDPKILQAVRHGNIPESLIADLQALVSASLVIRTDLATENQRLRQLLPRTNEVRDAEAAITFLQATLEKLQNEGVAERIAFIFHNFIPAVSSAFAYAAPGQRKVLIEALWGLPEGLYYNSHDKFEVDTGAANLGEAPPESAEKFRTVSKPSFKKYFVAPDEDGNWVTKNIAEPWDWRRSIKNDEWIQRIAFDSKRIAEKEGRSVSVMWFVGVPNWVSHEPLFPWYHEPFDLSSLHKISPSRGKTPFDKSLVIRTKADIAVLERETELEEASLLREVRIQPRENDLLRDKELLKNIGELTKKIGAVILLEGGTLSHAYYQLMQTQAVVEVVHPFGTTEERREFNKLVRDKIPKRIQDGGESVRVTRLEGDQLLRVLREKLVEEACEALDAAEHDAIVDELADVQEVIEALLKQLKVKRTELRERQKSKALKAGSFDEGFVLLDTRNPTPHVSDRDQNLSLAFDIGDSPESSLIEHARPPATSPVLAKWSDRREHGAANERLLNLVVSLVGDQWSAESPDIPIGAAHETVRAHISAHRERSNLHLEISLYSRAPIQHAQLKLAID